MQNTAQFGRAYRLSVTTTSYALDLSNLHFKFTVTSADVETPNRCVIRIYNLSETNAARLKNKEFTGVVLEAGYQNNVNYGIIFKGDIKRINSGRESNVDSYVEIHAADSDLTYNFGFVNTPVAAGASPQTQLGLVAGALGALDLSAENAVQFGGILPRGSIIFGLARAQMREIANTVGARWSIQNGMVTLIPLTGYLPGEAVILNSQTGLIGTPEATDNGITARMLLNAKLRIGGAVKINQNLINQQIVQQQGYPNYTSIALPATTTFDGQYRVLDIQHDGDTRGQPWYTDIICLNIDPTAADPCQAFPTN